MKTALSFDAYVEDARDAYRLFESMRTAELLDLKAAHEADLLDATQPETIAFGAGRCALIATVLIRRGIVVKAGALPSITCPRCSHVSWNLNDIKEKYCGFCHEFHATMPEARR